MNSLYKFSIRFFFFLNINLLSITLYSQNIVVRSKNLSTYYEYIDNQSGEVISHYYYDQASPFIEGMARVSRNGLWGFIDTKGDEVIECKFLNAFDFNQGIASVSTGKLVYTGNIRHTENEKYGAIDKKGNILINLTFSYINQFKDGIAIAKFNNDIHGMYGWINKTGGWQIMPKYSSCNDFDEYGMAKVQIEKRITTDSSSISSQKYGYINYKGDYLIQPIFDYLGDFINNKAVAKLGGTGYIDRLGNDNISFIYDYADGFNNKIALVQRKNLFGYINEIGEEVIPLTFDEAAPFYKNKALVLKNGKYGWINSNGNYVINNDYDYVFDFPKNPIQINYNENGSSLNNDLHDLAIVSKNGFWGAIDSLGKEIIPIIFDYIEWDNNYFFTLSGNEKKYFTKNGKFITNPTLLSKKNKSLSRIESKDFIPLNYSGNKIDLETNTNPYDKDSINLNYYKWLKIIKKENKFGIVDQDQNLICPFEFDSIRLPTCQYETIALGYKYKKVYIIILPNSKNWLNNTTDALLILPTDYSEINNYMPLGGACSSWMRVKSGQKYGVIAIVDKKIKEILSPVYDDVGILPSKSTLIPVKKSNKWGIIEPNDLELIVPFFYENISGFSESIGSDLVNENLSFVKKNSQWALINESGQLITNFIFDDVSCFRWGLAPVKKGKKWGYIDKTGRNITPFIFDSVDELRYEPYYIFGKINQMKLLFWLH